MFDGSCFVVGSSGFLGTAVVNQLTQLKNTVFLSGRGNPLLGDSFFRNISTSEKVSVIWLASSVTPASAELDKGSCDYDYSSLESFVTWLVKNSPASRVILASSGGAVYSNGTPPFDEDSPVSEAFAYARLKLKMENVLLESGLPCGVLRVSNAYGPGQYVGRGQGVLAEWINSINKKEPLNVFGSLDVSRDFVHVNDVARAFGLTLNNPDVKGVFNIGSGIPVKLSTCISILEDVTARTAVLNITPSRAVDRQSVFLDINKAQEELGWSPEIPLRDGLEQWWRLLQC